MAAQGSQGGAAEKAPDALGKDGRVQTVVNMLRNIQQRAFNLRVDQTANSYDDDHPAPSAPQRTIAQERKWLADAEQRLLDEYGGLMADVRRALGD